jgi:hypothetical protein
LIYKKTRRKNSNDKFLVNVVKQEPKYKSGEICHDFSLSNKFYKLEHAVWLYLNNQKPKSCEEFKEIEEKKIFSVIELKDLVCE